MASVLIVGDHLERAEITPAQLAEHGGHRVRVAATAGDALGACEREHPDVVVLPARLPDESSVTLLGALPTSEMAVVIVSEHADAELALDALRAGADVHIALPTTPTLLALAIARAAEHARARQALRRIGQRSIDIATAALAGSSATLTELRAQVTTLATSEQAVLLLGEAGTGKRLVARHIHAHSRRAARPMLELVCDSSGRFATDEPLLGVEPADRKPAVSGWLEIADGGTLLLDDVGALPMAAQRPLLDELEGRAHQPVGASVPLSTSARVLASTHRDLVNEVTTGRFREDLYYRLSVTPVYLPPLRARSRDDLVELVETLIPAIRGWLPDSPSSIDGIALDGIVSHAWPGNLRELRAVLERAMVLARGRAAIGAEHLPADLRLAGSTEVPHEPRTLAAVERAQIERALRAHAGNRTHASRELGIARATLIKKIKEYESDQQTAAD
jgi:DNA-binding NtrC family response regulator